jgi:hypothetical protein
MSSTPDVLIASCFLCSSVVRWLVLRLISLAIEALQEHETRIEAGNNLEPRALGLLGAQPSHLNPHALPNTKVSLVNSQQLLEITSLLTVFRPLFRAHVSRHVRFDILHKVSSLTS